MPRSRLLCPRPSSSPRADPMLRMEIGGTEFQLDPSAISAIRFRAEYGESIINKLSDCRSGAELEGLLLRMCHMMIPLADRPELLDLARLARRDPDFLRKALKARAALLAGDPKRKPRAKSAEETESYDEYKVLALVAVAGVDMSLIYELPIMHLMSIANRVFELRNPDQKTYRPMTQEEMTQLYPRR